MNEESREIQFSYGYNKDFDQESTLEFVSSARRNFGEGPTAQEFRVNGIWRRQFINGSALSMGLGYHIGTSDLDDNSGINSHLNFDYPMSNQLGLALQLDYSRNRADYHELDLANDFFTNDEFLDDNFDRVREFSALLRLSYQLGGRRRQSVLSDRTRFGGVGGIRGYVYVDSNSDRTRHAGGRWHLT